MKHAFTQNIETDRLILRRFEQGDAQAMFTNWASDGEVTKYLMWPAHQSAAASEIILRDWLSQYEKPDYYQWAIVPRETMEPVGSIGVVQINEGARSMHVGYCIGRKHWGKGLMTEAFSAVIAFLFRETDVNRVEARHDPRNPASGRVMQKCGMTYEGTLRSADHNNQGICDAAYYGILRSEWEKMNRA